MVITTALLPPDFDRAPPRAHQHLAVNTPRARARQPAGVHQSLMQINTLAWSPLESDIALHYQALAVS